MSSSTSSSSQMPTASGVVALFAQEAERQENKAVVDLTANAEKRTVLTPTKIEEITDHALSGAVQQATITWWNEAHQVMHIYVNTYEKL